MQEEAGAGEGARENALVRAMSGHICRCTGYQGIRRAIRQLSGHQPAADEAEAVA